MKKTFFYTIALLSSVIFLSGCNTVHGFGQDVQSGGKALEKASTESSSGTTTSNNGNSSYKSSTTTTTQKTTY